VTEHSEVLELLFPGDVVSDRGLMWQNLWVLLVLDSR